MNKILLDYYFDTTPIDSNNISYSLMGVIRITHCTLLRISQWNSNYSVNLKIIVSKYSLIIILKI